MSESFESFYEKTKEQYAPTLMTYAPEDMDALRERIESYLRPAYEKALKKQEQQAALYNGQLDADAWSRGMGASTYVSDLKYRRQNQLLENRGDLEASYGAALAEQLFKAWETQLGYRMEAEKFNAQAQNAARDKALTAAESMYKSYLASLARRQRAAEETKEEEAADIKNADLPKGAVAGSKNTAVGLWTRLNKRGNKTKIYGHQGNLPYTQSRFVQN